MNVHKSTCFGARARGITLIEILLALSVLVILVAVGLPSVGNATARADMKAAIENLEYSFDTARKVARLTESSVTVVIESAAGQTSQTIRFTGSGPSGRHSGPDIPDYVLPSELLLESEHDRFVFDRRGLVEQPGIIRLASRADETISSELYID